MLTGSGGTTSSQQPLDPPVRRDGGRRLAALACLLLFTPGDQWITAARAAEPDGNAAKIRVGSEVEFPPYATLDGNGQPAGFSVDLLRAVSRAAGLEPRFTTGPWDQVWRDLVAGDLDVLPIVAVSDERRKLVDFGLPHTETFDAFFVRQGDREIPDLRAAEGKTIGVMRSDAAHHELLERGFRGRIELVDTIPDGLAQVAGGKTDAFLCSKLVGVLSMQERGIRGLVAGPPVRDYKRVFAFGLRKGAGDLKERLDQGLLLVKTSGEYDRIHDTWLTYDDPWRRYRPYLPAAFVLLGLGAVLATLGMAAQRRRARLLRSILDTALRDVTERKLAEDTVRRQSALLGALVDNPRDIVIFSLDREYRYTVFNDKHRQEMRRVWNAEIRIGTSLLEYMTDSRLRELARQSIDRALGGDSFIEIAHQPGVDIFYEFTWDPIHGVDGRVEGVTAFVRDITERKRAEEALRSTRDYLENLIDHANAPIIVWDGGRKITLFNDAFEGMTGYSAGEVKGRNLELLFPEESRVESLAKIATTAEGSRWESVEIPIRCKSGEVRVALWNSANIYGADGTALQATIAQGQDITERKRAEEALRESEKVFRDLFENHAAATLILDPDTGKIVDANQAAANFYGWPRDRLRQMRIQQINTLSSTEVEQAISRARTRGSMHFEFRHRLADGSIRDVDVFTSKVVVHGKEQLHSTIHDSTARKRAEEALVVANAQLAMNSRLAALGTLVAGVAHEINNPLAAALSDQELAGGAARELRARLRESGPLDREAAIHHLDEVVEELDEAQEAGRRIARIVQDLRTFGRPNQTDARESIRLADVVEKAMRWLPATIHQTATVTVEDAGAPDVVATAGQITQVVVNLVTNAAKATSDGVRGAIVIRIGPGNPGMARLEVIDHGTGIAPAVLAHVFEPFFTTREVGKGTGLGLSICHSIVTSHGGTLTVTSEVGKGSTFRVELPAASAEA
jgi:PAS domain S-box-containing protein